MRENKYKKLYYDGFRSRPTWPMDLHRLGAIYGTLARAIRGVGPRQKENLKEQLLDFADEFDRNCKCILSSQSSFDRWLDSQIATIQGTHFPWTDARWDRRTNIEFGTAQKFVNVMLKDWWCWCPEAEELDCSFLHAPFDNIVSIQLTGLTRIRFPSLRQGGYYVHLSRDDYDRYQEHLVSAELRKALGLDQPLTRVEIDTLLWAPPNAQITGENAHQT